MPWLWIILRCLFPRDPVKQAAEAARHCIAKLVALVDTDEALLGLQECEQSRAYVEAIRNDYEASVYFAIAMRACQIAGIPFCSQERPFHQPAKPKSLAELLRRIAALAKLCADMERLAQLRAVDLKRQHDADPLAAHGSTDASLRDAAHHDAVKFTDCQTGLILRDRAAIVSKDEAVLTFALTRALPHSIAGANPQHASQASPARPRTRAQNAKPFRLPQRQIDPARSPRQPSMKAPHTRGRPL
jgi:hypothetical protein